MADNKKRSFSSVVWKQYSDDIEKAVSVYVDENWQQLDLHAHRVQNPDEAYLDDLRFHRLISYDAPGDIIKFDIVVIAGIAIFETSHSQAIDGEVDKWFRVSCEVELNDGLHDFRIIDIDEYDHRQNNPQGYLTDSLVPYIGTAQLEQTAEAILKQYYPQALEKPAPVDVRVFAENMGLTIKEARLSRTGTIFGVMIFTDCTIDYYDLDIRRFDLLEVERKTLLVDPEVYFLRSLGSWNNTVIHECVHWEKHRKVFELERMYNENVRMIRCQVSEKETDEQKRTDTGWMEWHANALAPRIQMPRNPFRQKAAELIAEYKKSWQTENVSDVMPSVILELSDFFGVSLQAAKIRMIDVGYTEAIGTYEYVDDRYVPSHSFKDGAIGKNQTYSVPIVDSIIEYAVNPDFGRMMDSGNFVYVDSHFCINDPKYVVQNEHGIFEMTEYATRNMDECCLSFDRTTRPNTSFGANRYTECVLFQHAVSKTISDFKYNHTDHNKDVEARAAVMRAEIDEAKSAAKMMESLPATFHQALVALMKWRGMTNEQLAEKALISSKTIQRMRNDPDHKNDLETVIAVCIGLQLPPYISDPFIEKAGLKLKVGEKGITYAHLLTTLYQNPIHEFNEYLEVAGYPPLSGKE